MNDPTTPGDGLALLRALRLNQQRQLREASEARLRARLVSAAGVDPNQLSAQGQRTLAWLSGGDDSTVDGLMEIFTAARTAAQVALQREAIAEKVAALRASEAATDAAFVRYDEQEARRRGRD